MGKRATIYLRGWPGDDPDGETAVICSAAIDLADTERVMMTVLECAKRMTNSLEWVDNPYDHAAYFARLQDGMFTAIGNIVDGMSADHFHEEQTDSSAYVMALTVAPDEDGETVVHKMDLPFMEAVDTLSQAARA